MLKIWKRMLIPVILFILFFVGFCLCDAISNPDISGAIGAVALFLLFPLFIAALIWAMVSGVLLTSRYLKYPHITMMELNHTRVETLMKQLKNYKQTRKNMTPAQRKRCSIFHIGGGLGSVIGFLMICTGRMGLITVGTVLLCFGLSFFMFSFPDLYNNEVDLVKMIPVRNSVSIEQVFADICDLDTIMGSAALVGLATMKQKCVLFGPMPGQSTYLYGYFNGSGTVFYLGEAVIDGWVSEIYTEPKILPHEPDDATASLSSVISYNASAEFLKGQLFDFFQTYFANGTVGEIPYIEPEGVYLFDEQFKLTGEKFSMTDTDSHSIYQIDATYPLKSFHMYEADREVFYMTKELVHVFPTYRFTRKGEFYGVLEKELTFARDRYVIGTEDGEFVLDSMTSMLGNNYRVTLDGRLIGLIMDDLSITFRNMVFDNSVITVYEDRYRDVVAAMAVMAVRDIKRDQS